MKVIESKSGFQNVPGAQVLTIGNFDGVHLGHQKIIKAAKVIARNRHTKLIAMTFDPHPAAILHPEKAPAILTPLRLKQFLLDTIGVDFVIVIRDSLELLNLSPRNFIDEFLLKTVKPAAVVEGANFNFGYGRSGNADTLRQLSAQRGFDVTIVDCRKIELNTGQTAVVSSSLIRNLLESGSVADAAAALGRNYRLLGRVIKGRGKGAQLGFPTANIEPLQQIIPAEGVYAGFVAVADTCEQLCESHQKLPAALSIGRAKTFLTNHPLLYEAHILNKDTGNLFDKWLAMDFVTKLRNQRRFENEDELKKQITKDCKKATEALAVDLPQEP